MMIPSWVRASVRGTYYGSRRKPLITKANDIPGVLRLGRYVRFRPTMLDVDVENAISGIDKMPAEARDYVRAIRAEADAAQKLRLYATALRSIQPRLAPLIRLLQGAAPLDTEMEAGWQGISRRRAKNMRLLAEVLAATGRLRTGLSVARAADIIWSMNSPEFYILLVEQRA